MQKLVEENCRLKQSCFVEESALICETSVGNTSISLDSRESVSEAANIEVVSISIPSEFQPKERADQATQTDLIERNPALSEFTVSSQSSGQ